MSFDIIVLYLSIFNFNLFAILTNVYIWQMPRHRNIYIYDGNMWNVLQNIIPTSKWCMYVLQHVDTALRSKNIVHRICKNIRNKDILRTEKYLSISIWSMLPNNILLSYFISHFDIRYIKQKYSVTIIRNVKKQTKFFVVKITNSVYSQMKRVNHQ